MKFAKQLALRENTVYIKPLKSLKIRTVMNPEGDSNLISKFFSRELEDKEREQFEQKMQDDPSFVQKFKRYRQVNEMVGQAYGDEDKKTRIAEWKSEIDALRTPRPLFRLMIAAVFGILCLTFAYLWFEDSLGNSTTVASIDESLQSAWPESPPLISFSDRGGEISPDAGYRRLLTEAFDEYTDEAYDSVITTLSPFVSGIPYLEDAQLLRGLALYHKGQKREALAEMEAIIQSEKDRKKGQALWYAALIRLEFKDVSDAKRYLEQIISTPYATAPQATRLLEQIEDLE